MKKLKEKPDYDKIVDNITNELPKMLFQKYINGIKIVIEATSLEEAEIKFNSYIKSNE